jgi:hypothetical protein
VTHILRQTMRGCGALPYLGDHPGTFILLMVSILGALAGGWIGAVVMLVVFGPFYLMGAYERAQYSDQLVRDDEFENDMGGV